MDQRIQSFGAFTSTVVEAGCGWCCSAKKAIRVSGFWTPGYEKTKTQKKKKKHKKPRKNKNKKRREKTSESKNGRDKSPGVPGSPKRPKSRNKSPGFLGSLRPKGKDNKSGRTTKSCAAVAVALVPAFCRCLYCLLRPW